MHTDLDDNDAAWHQLQLEQQQHRNTNMTDINSLTFDQLVPKNSKFLSKSDVGEDGIVLTIRGFKMETVSNDDSEEDKTIMYFTEAVKPMVLNRTNSQLLEAITGAKTAGEARGKQIVVYNDPTIGFAGRITGGLRIRKAHAQPKVAKAVDEIDDNIPF